MSRTTVTRIARSASALLLLLTFPTGCTKFKNPSPDGGDGGQDHLGVEDGAFLDVGGESSTSDTGSRETSTEVPPAAPGSVLWARSASSAVLYGVAEGPTGVVVTGSISAPANLGGSLLAPMGANDTVIAQYATADGAHLYSSRFGGSSPAGTGSVFGFLDTVDQTGAPLIEGISSCNPSGTPACTQIDVGRGAVDPGGGPDPDAFIGRYSVSTGQPTWVTRLVGAGNDKFASVAGGPSGTIYVTGWFDQNTTLAAGTTTRMFVAGGDRDVLIAQLNASTGEIGMTKTFAGPGFEQPSGIAWTGSHIIAAGFLSGTTAFGTTTLTSVDFDIWVAKLVPTDGTPVWAVRLGGQGPDKYPYIVVDGAGDIYVAGFVTGSVTLGSYSVGGAGGTDVFVAKLRNGDGGVMWATSFGSSGDDAATDIAISSSGQLVVGATIAGPLQAGGPWAGSTDAAIVSFNADGTRLWTKVIGTSGGDYGAGLTSGTNAVYATVNLGADVGTSIEGIPIIGAPGPVGLLLKLQP